MNTPTVPYFPKPIRGVSYPGYVRISRSQLKRFMAQGNRFDGFIVGNNVNPFHFFDGWELACPLEKETLAEMERAINEFEFYLEAELGNRAAIFLKKP